MALPNPSAPTMANTPTPPNPSEDPPGKSFMAFRVVMPEKENSPNFVFHGALSYYTFTLGVGLIILGSILTFVLNDQHHQTYDPFSKNLTVTAILFLVIGCLLITSTIIKCLYPCCLRESLDDVTDIKFDAPPKETKGQHGAAPPDNTILYNPFYPPVLVPSYSVDKTQQQQLYNFGGENYITFPNGNYSLLPGTLIYAEDSSANQKVNALESQLMQKLEVPTNTSPPDEMRNNGSEAIKNNGSDVIRNNGSAIRDREQILQVDDLAIEQLQKF